MQSNCKNRILVLIIMLTFCSCSVVTLLSKQVQVSDDLTYDQKLSVVKEILQKLYLASGQYNNRFSIEAIEIKPTSKIASCNPFTKPAQFEVDPRLIDICYSVFGKERYKTALACVLGHELAHLLNGHKDIHEITQRSKELFGFASTKYFSEDENYIERDADISGAFYSTLAGYDVVSDTIWAKTFYLVYNSFGITDEKTVGNHYFPLTKRETIGFSIYKQLAVNIPVVQQGYYAMYAGQYSIAQLYLSYVRNVYKFPSAELLNTLGVCYALKATSDEKSKPIRWQYPFCVKMDMLYERQRSVLGALELDDQKRRMMDSAISIFNMVISRFPDNGNAYQNIACCYCILGKYDSARMMLDSASKYLNGTSIQLPNILSAIVVYEEDTGKLKDAMILLEKANISYPFLVEYNKNIMLNTQQSQGYSTRNKCSGYENINGKEVGSLWGEVSVNINVDKSSTVLSLRDSVVQYYFDSQLFSASVQENYKANTACGVKIGSTVNDVKTIYGTPNRVFATPYGEVLCYDDTRSPARPQILFTIIGDKLASWTLVAKSKLD
ncbi:MAG: hypothetical protein U0Y96_02425 [Candidatus Kapaibacterium sp.]